MNKFKEMSEYFSEAGRTCIWKGVGERQLDLYGEERVGRDMIRCALDCDGLWDYCKFYFAEAELKNGRPH